MAYEWLEDLNETKFEVKNDVDEASQTEMSCNAYVYSVWVGVDIICRTNGWLDTTRDAEHEFCVVFF